MREIFKDVYTWARFSEEHRLNFNGWFILRQHPLFGNLSIDPPPPSEADLDQMKSLGGVQQIVITNRNHVRWSRELQQRFGAKIGMHAADASTVDLAVDHQFEDGHMVAGFLHAVTVPNNKSSGETALHWPERKLLILGDALIGKPSGWLTLLAPEKYADVALAKEGIQTLLGLEFDAILLGDGEPILKNGKEAMERFLKEH